MRVLLLSCKFLIILTFSSSIPLILYLAATFFSSNMPKPQNLPRIVCYLLHKDLDRSCRFCGCVCCNGSRDICVCKAVRAPSEGIHCMLCATDARVKSRVAKNENVPQNGARVPSEEGDVLRRNCACNAFLLFFSYFCTDHGTPVCDNGEERFWSLPVGHSRGALRGAPFSFSGRSHRSLFLNSCT